LDILETKTKRDWAVPAHHAAETNHVGSKDGGELALGRGA